MVRSKVLLVALVVASLLGCYGAVIPTKKGSGGVPFASSPAGTIDGGRAGQAQVALLGSGAAVFGGRSAIAPATDTIYVFSGGVVGLSRARLATARTEAVAVVLSSGDVLVVGGQDPSGSALASTEIFSPGADTVRAGPVLQVARTGAIVLLEGDTVFVVGGADTGPGAGQVETWSVTSGGAAFVLEKASLLAARVGAHALEVAPGKLLVVGGMSRARIAAPELLDLATGARPLGVPQGMRTGASLVGLGARFFVLGGGLPTVVGDGDTLVGSALVTSLVRLPAPRAFAATVALSSEGALILGGQGASGESLESSVELDETAGEVELRAGPGLLAARSDPRASLLADGTIFLSGGVDPTGVPVEECELLSRGRAPVATIAPTSTAATTTGSTASISTRSFVVPRTTPITLPFLLPSP